MECPRCGNMRFETYNTRNMGGGKVRYRRCVDSDESPGCGLVFRTHESIITVEVFNPGTLRSENIDVKDYKKEHLQKELKGLSGFQPRMFGQ